MAKPAAYWVDLNPQEFIEEHPEGGSLEQIAEYTGESKQVIDNILQKALFKLRTMPETKDMLRCLYGD